MNVAIGSAFRNMTHRVNVYLSQVLALQDHLGEDHHVRVIAVEGDSVDFTDEALVARADLWDVDLEVIKHEHGLPWFGSTEKPERLKALTGVSNAVFAGVKLRDDVLLYVESDLLWTPNDVGSVIDMAYRQDDGFDIVAPLCFAGEAFYDIWGFRGTDDERFGPFYPYHEAMPSAGLAEIHSAGSCLAMRAEVAMTVVNDSEMALVGWCTAAREAGYRIGCAVDYEVRHP